jgi:glycosyltransferase involved in cell wall biosynthesis
MPFNARNVFLHLSHTDIRIDSRILKEMTALKDLVGYEVVGIGFELEQIEAPEAGRGRNGVQIHTKLLATRRWRILPRSIRYALNFFELTLKLLIPAIKLQPSIVHCHDTLVLPVGWLIKMMTGCKLVYDAHELESNKNGQSAFLSKCTLLIERLSWPSIDLLISVSNLILDWYKTNLGNKETVLILNSPIFDSNSIATKNHNIIRSNYLHNKFEINKDDVLFVYLGILGPGRGIEVMIKAFESGPKNAHAIFVGYGTYESEIIETSRRCSNIHFHPAVPHDQVVSLVSNANFGLCMVENISLSDYYCLPNKLFEYSFANIPVLASRLPEISNLVQSYSLGICCDLNESSIRDILEEIVTTKPIFHRRDISDLSWDVQATRLVGAYRNLLSRK